MPESPESPTADLLPVEAPEIPEEEQELERELLPKLSGETERLLVSTIHADHVNALEDRADLEKEWAADEDAYHGILPEKTFPWDGCSNFNVPMVMLGVETLKPRFTESVLGGDPMVYAIPTEAFDEAAQERTELYLNWQAKNEMRLDPIIRQSAHLYLQPGTVIAKIRWRVDQRKSKSVRRFPTGTDVTAMFRAIFGPVTPTMERKGDREWTGEITQPGSPARKVRVKFRFLPDEIQALVERDDVRYEGPQVDLIPTEDFIAPVKGGGDIQALPWCQHRLWYDEQALRLKVKQGRFDKAAVEMLLETTRPTDENSQQDSRELRETRAGVEGVAQDASTSVRDTQWEILEDYRRWDIDDDGMEEEIITWSCRQLPDRVLGWDYLDNVYAHGMRPFERGVYLDEPGRFYGLSFHRTVRGIQEEINTIHNQRVDLGTLINTPGGWVRASSSITAEQRPLKPGEFRAIDNPQTDVREFQWTGNTVWGQNEEALLWQIFERLTGITDLALGRQPNRVGATRTATGVASLLSEAGLRFKNAMQGFQDFWTRILTQIHMLNQQLIPPGKEFRVTGRWPELIRIEDRSEIAGRYDLRLSATTESLNRQVQREDATVKLQTALNPIWMQMGLIGPKGFYRLLRAFFRSYGESDPDLILEPPRDMIVMTPEQELAAFLAGEDPQPSMLENLAQHVETHMAQEQDPVVREQLGPEGMARLTKHLAKTMQLAQMQAMAMALQQKGGAGGGGGAVGPQAMNAQVGRNAPNQPASYGNGAGLGPQGAPGPMAGQMMAAATSNRGGR